ncbi:MAG: biosynthetic-type acetolactate synthase large subunit, partial [Bdellovibrionales bacterium]|nr:biosynthetic-type acetolactate synthase large subunit [Bdellovibrionales bacterium]
YPGGAIMPAYDALLEARQHIRHVLVRHEQGASHAAEGYAHITGKAGVCIATSGPGATNLVTGIADAMMDSVPLVCITGQVFSSALGTDAFQEADVISLTMPITKWNYQVTDAKQIPYIISKAFYLAQSGRPGPVLIDITKDAQMDRFELTDFKRYEPPVYDYAKKHVDLSQIDYAAKLINASKRPFMLVGHGVKLSGAERQVLALAERASIPVGCTLHGLSSFPTGHALYAGMLGMHGNYGPNVLTNQADLIIAVGMRFDDRVTGRVSDYAKKAKVIHVEVDPAEIGKVIPATAAIIADAAQALDSLLPLVEPAKHDDWIKEFRRLDELEYEKVIRSDHFPSDGQIKMSETIRLLSELTDGRAVVVADVGQHQMMAARYYRFRETNSWMTSGGLGTMGFALPAALGAKLASPNREVVAVIGDGGFQMTLQELGTIAQEGLAVKVIVLNNNYLGMVRQWQELFFDRRYSHVYLNNPDFVKIVDGFGIRAQRVEKRSDLKAGLEAMINSKEAFFLEVVVEKEENVFPMIATGASVDEMRLE